jgi:hypothetical protein
MANRAERRSKEYQENKKHFQAQNFGLTKREYFAGLALMGQLANVRVDESLSNVDTLAEFSLQYADALLKELDKNETD